MDLNHSFTVNVPIDDAWRILTDVERIAPCLPGAQLQEIEGDTYRGAVKVKVGPIQAQFKGQANFLERDEVAYHIVLKGEGRDIGGKGNASAIITADLTAVTDSSTSVVVNTDLSITGKVAQFGRGTMADISNKLLAQFVENLNVLIAEQPVNTTDATPPSSQPDTSSEAPGSSSEPVVRKIDAPEAEALNLLSVSTGAIAKRAIPVAIVVVAVLAFFILR
jgi:carbon monoxide dehydrogenase subunit G